ncbi:MAG TPA: hypothetical protein VGL37_02660 [Solirubrobacteraceae bacterium]
MLSLCLLPEPAAATVATPLGGAFSITPARRYIVAHPPLTLAPTGVANTTQVTLDVHVIPVLLSQLPSGAFSYELTPLALRAARGILSSDTSHFVLPPGASREVSLDWHDLPRRARTANLGVIYQAMPVARGTPVRIVEQLLGVDILRLPGHYRSSGQLTDLRVSQLKPRTLRLALDAHNSGQDLASPSRIALTIHDHTGRRVLARSLATDIVLPGATREFVLNLAHPLPAGSYTAIGHMAFGSSHDLATRTSFQLIAPNELPSSQMQLRLLTAQGAVSQGAQVAAQTKNTGSAPGTLDVALRLYRLNEGIPASRPIATRAFTTPPLAPGHTSQLREALGRGLHPGTYRLLADYHAIGGAPQTLIADFQAQQPLDLLAELRGISREHALLLPGLLILATSVLLTLVLARERQHRDALQAARRQIDELERQR